MLLHNIGDNMTGSFYLLEGKNTKNYVSSQSLEQNNQLQYI